MIQNGDSPVGPVNLVNPSDDLVSDVDRLRSQILKRSRRADLDHLTDIEVVDRDDFAAMIILSLRAVIFGRLGRTAQVCTD